jgi:hypothetical protein
METTLNSNQRCLKIIDTFRGSDRAKYMCCLYFIPYMWRKKSLR